MNAVNLAPAGANRRRRTGGGPKVALSAPSLALLGGLLVVLLATFLFVSAHNRVTSRRAELTQLQAGVGQWTAAASGFEGQVAQFTQRSRSLAGVHQLIAERYHWSLLLSKIAGVTPADVQLSSLQASTPAATTDGSAAGATGTPATDGVTVAGCAASHPAVAAAMVSLRRVTGIANVVLASSAKGAGSVSAPSSGGGGCTLPVQFQLTLVFNASAAETPAATPATSTGTSGVAQ